MREHYAAVIADLKGQAGGLLGIAEQLEVVVEVAYPPSGLEHDGPTPDPPAPKRTRPESYKRPARETPSAPPLTPGPAKDGATGPTPPRRRGVGGERSAKAAELRHALAAALVANGAPMRPRDAGAAAGMTGANIAKRASDILARMAKMDPPECLKIGGGLYAAVPAENVGGVVPGTRETFTVNGNVMVTADTSPKQVIPQTGERIIDLALVALLAGPMTSYAVATAIDRAPPSVRTVLGAHARTGRLVKKLSDGRFRLTPEGEQHARQFVVPPPATITKPSTDERPAPPANGKHVPTKSGRGPTGYECRNCGRLAEVLDNKVPVVAGDCGGA